jgi:hypothetical protein
MQLDLTIITKIKEIVRYCESDTYGGKSTLNTYFYYFNVS